MRKRLLLLPLLLVGCASKEPLPKFYVLTPAGDATVVRSARNTVFVRRVGVPAYLARANLASMGTGNQVHYSTTGRWAEPLDQGIARAVADELTARGIGAIGFQPSIQISDHRYDVNIRLIRFEGNANGQVVLSATWQVLPAASGVPLVRRATNTVLDGWTPGDEAGLAALLSQAVRRMADQIARAIP